MGLSEEELEQFQNLGYLVKERIFSNDDLQPLRDGITESIQDACDRLMEVGGLDQDFQEASFETRLSKIYQYNRKAGQEVYMSIHSGRFHGPGMLKVLRHLPLIACIEDLIGPDIMATSIYRIRPKLPYFSRGEVPWHQDAGYMMSHCNNYLVITCWVPIVDATVDNGCLWVIPKGQDKGVIRHYTGGHAGYLEIASEDVPDGAIPLEMKAGSVLFLTNLTPHASFENNTEFIRWSIDLRYQDFDVPNNVDEVPEDYFPERDPVTMACNPDEAYFVIQDLKYPNREMRNPEEFAKLRRHWDSSKVKRPGRGWTPLSDRHNIQ